MVLLQIKERKCDVYYQASNIIQMKASIIMPTYNKDKYLDLTLSGFCNQTYENFEIIIVNDGSYDNTEEIIKKYSKTINIIYRAQDNRGRSAARNAALSLAVGEIIIFCDDDRIPDKNFIYEHVSLLKDKKKIVSVGNKMELISILKRDSLYKFSFFLEMLNKSMLNIENYYDDIKLFSDKDVIENFNDILEKFLLLEPADNFKLAKEHYGDELKGCNFGWAMATTANMGMNRNDLDNIFFDSNYIGWGMEDTDFAFQLYKEKSMFVIASKAINYHQYHEKDSNYLITLKQNLQYFHEKYTDLEAVLFAYYLGSEMNIIDLNNIYNCINSNPCNIVYKDYLKLISDTILGKKYINISSLS